jgi:hypothetical protein
MKRFNLNWRILLNAIRNFLTITGLAGTVGYFAGSKIFPIVIGVFILAGSVAACYFLEIRFREFRLSRGWYR